MRLEPKRERRPTDRAAFGRSIEKEGRLRVLLSLKALQRTLGSRFLSKRSRPQCGSIKRLVLGELICAS